MSASTTAGIGGGGIAGSLSGAMIGAEIGSLFPGIGTIVGFTVGAIIGGVIGSSVGALALLIGKPVSAKKNAIELQTTQIRDTPVPVVFGRGRLGGNLIDLGNFDIAKDNIAGTPGGTVRVINCVVGICEGSILALGNVHQDNVPIFVVAGQNRANPDNFMKFLIHIGNSSDAVDSWITTAAHGYNLTNQVPYHNTCYSVCYTIVGPQPRIPNYTFDLYGPPLTVNHSGSTGEPLNGDVSSYIGYDGHTERFWYTLTASSVTSAPFGLVLVGRQGEARFHQSPPAGVSSVSNAWYLGRHDIIVMQDPATNTKFWIGFLNIGASDWEYFTPSQDYSSAIISSYMDELHGILHTLHDDGTYRYFLQWNLLTGRVDRINTDLPVASYGKFLYSPDFDSYISIRSGSTIDFTDPHTGESISSYVSTVTDIVGICVSGQMVGLVTPLGFYYYAPYTQGQYGPYGSSGSGVTRGEMGVTQACSQNSWTGHVSLFKPNIGLINFIPSTIEDIQDVNANGSSPAYETIKAMPDFQWLPGDPSIIADGTRSWRSPIYPPTSPSDSLWYTDNTIGWVRDWSVRTHNSYTLVSLQGFSSLAGALWASMVAEPGLNSARWGGGLQPELFSLSSFESVHWYCVGTMDVINKDGTTHRFAERYKFDHVLDSETSLGSYVSDNILACCQGYRTTIDGKLHVGIQRQGMLPVWHFSDGQINQSGQDGTFNLKFIGRAQNPNRVRVIYKNILNEYASDFAEATDDFDINSRQRVQQATLSLNGIGRFCHADILCKATLDQASASKRLAEFKTHFVWAILCPGDGVEISERQSALTRLPMRVTLLNEQSQSECQMTCLEQISVLEVIKGANESSGIDTGSGGAAGGGLLGGGSCGDFLETPDTSTDISWFNGGAAYSADSFLCTYQNGAYSKGTGWGWSTDGWDLVTRTSGSIVVLVAAPGLVTIFPGYASQDAAEATNAGQSTTVTLAAAGPIGIRRTSALPVVVNSSSMPVFQLCIP